MVGHRVEQGHVGVRNNADPIGIQILIRGRALRVDRDELGARVADLSPRTVHTVVRHRIFDAVVLDRITADQHEHFGIVADHFPCGLGGIHLHITDDMRQADLACTG